MVLKITEALAMHRLFTALSFLCCSAICFAQPQQSPVKDFIKVPAGVKIMKMASGPSDSDYDWTETMMRIAGKHIDGLGLHYYTLPGDWGHKGPAIGFDAASARDTFTTCRHPVRVDSVPKRANNPWLWLLNWPS